MQQRYFTLEQANARLPWLEAKLAAMTLVRDELAKRQEDLIALLRNRRSNGHSSTEEEIMAAQRTVEGLTQQLQGELREIADEGILVRDLGRGLVDFPSRREGREVYLCWIRSEPEIAYWHETNVGFPGRQPL